MSIATATYFLAGERKGPKAAPHEKLGRSESNLEICLLIPRLNLT